MYKIYSNAVFFKLNAVKKEEISAERMNNWQEQENGSYNWLNRGTESLDTWQRKFFKLG